MRYITSTEQLSSCISEIEASSVLAIDTEFIREKTYYPRLCLLQMATENEVYIVDPLACADITALESALLDESIMKIFHAGSQDIEILLREVGCAPWPLFDTQIAAALLGQSHQVGFGSLVHTFLGVRLSKRDSYTDWSKRPLSDSQVHYAADDVVYLPELYRIMRDMLIEKGRLAWLDDDFRQLASPERYEADPSERYIRLKRVNQLSGARLAAARDVAAWRETTAQKRNVPRKWVIGDEEIVEACKREATTLDELFMVRGVKQHVSTRDARHIVEIIANALVSPPDSWPILAAACASEANVDAACDLMEALVRLRAKENGIAMQTLASHADLAALARGHIDKSAVMRGWRRGIVGDELVSLLEGRIALSLSGNETVVHRIS